MTSMAEVEGESVWLRLGLGLVSVSDSLGGSSERSMRGRGG